MGNLVARWCAQPNVQFPRAPFPHLPSSPALNDCLSSQVKSRIDLLFASWIKQVDELLEYPYWSPAQERQLKFYSEKLRSSLQVFPSFTITGQPNSIYLSSLFVKAKEYMNLTAITRLIKLMGKEPDIIDIKIKFNNKMGLKIVGDELVARLSGIYEACMHIFDKPKDSNVVCPDFASHFIFDEKKCQEQDEEVFVGFQEEASDLLKRLASITKKQLQVISIVGMAGLGKTTLARRLYNDPYLVSYFHVRVWVCCSQDYQQRDLLLGILRSVVEITDQICRMNDNMLAHELYRALMDRRYLIVIDDIWSSEAWDDLKRCFPNDNNGSKIMLTTRLEEVALHAQSDGNPLHLRFLTEEESFTLLRRKAFITEDLFNYLTLIGKRITKKCRGLPLAVVVIAGLLKSNLKIEWWAEVEERVSSYILTDENRYMDTLALSYDHLPQYLRPCFLYFGAFPEDYDIPVSKLVCLWIAEGFICHNSTEKRLEDVAADYLTDLASRSLVVCEKGSMGAIKTCRIHDLLRDLSLRKAEEENFLPNIYHNKHSYRCPHSLTSPSKKFQLLLNTNVHTTGSNCSCYSSEVSELFFKDVSIMWDTSKLIRALNISSIELFMFPSELLQLVHLRYLEIRFRSGNPPEHISNLAELQTLIMSSRMNMVVPENMWKMIKLRHLCIKSGENLVNFSNVDEGQYLLENLQTLSLVSPTRQCQHILARTRNLQKLGLCGPFTTKIGDIKFPDLGLLVHLKTLKLLNTTTLCKAGRLSDSIIFPQSLKSLSISNTYLDWKEAWVFEMIPNLEVLKLKLHAFAGKVWETSPEAFPRLKFLKLDTMDFVIWTASRNHFPVLQRLQVYRCPYLLELPDDFGNICTLEWIGLSGCSDAATESARDIQKEQESQGNNWLKILVNAGLKPN
ncbi:hypothetical protein DCAR_0313426 [Daucus carota subsp. sativus]|uniref:NB-ARC domain-containing protein n=1 Tax=Daucus carota subsp. sativus TaxID=79200 RepID=A0AAF0WT84_DAUCS|nr:PREDICTED: putative late blight resistance protein homolog R1A-10 [Daucus carota subsp. sativus]WOG94133.1 hypothetical protein DCAR_0313426 [Daucus carota subsp. sativus]